MLDMNSPIELQRPPVIRFGAGVLSTLAPWVEAHGFRRSFVVADPVNAARLDDLHIAISGVFSEVGGEPDLTMLDKAVAGAQGADLVIGFGGGSAMDLAKLVAVMTGHNRDFFEISGPNRAPKRKVGLVQIPTTAGTGSEVGTRSLVTDHTTRAKVATESLEMLADLALVDPELSISVPASVTAATGLDALAHCVEAYTSKRSHPLIDAYAMQGVELVGRYLARAVADGADVEARAGLSLAALYGGVCLGPVNTTAGHAVSYPLGTRHGLPHGLANALIFPHTLAANAPAVSAKTERISEALGFAGNSTDDVRHGAWQFCEALGLDMRLSAHGVPKDDLEHMASDAHAIRRLLDWNPVELSEQDITRIYETAW